jgi:hypothetical protein
MLKSGRAIHIPPICLPPNKNALRIGPIPIHSSAAKGMSSRGVAVVGKPHKTCLLSRYDDGHSRHWPGWVNATLLCCVVCVCVCGGKFMFMCVRVWAQFVARVPFSVACRYVCVLLFFIFYVCMLPGCATYPDLFFSRTPSSPYG